MASFKSSRLRAASKAEDRAMNKAFKREKKAAEILAAQKRGAAAAAAAKAPAAKPKVEA